ncbi:sensor domain-containing phosphodiesterase [Noviherbaspirillum galbum]|uniref:EAL domain-containing protein n=1 Tax=Noviherbaspirillum galbum TaxID=2709383 RepID=A0A6B3SRM7_9BURK|nr:EAL domain-containing protein [Noviherbaspirillum galbum]NEX63427.1 EAL domain-containing protein [Noviherbaspirillum galbum]
MNTTIANKNGKNLQGQQVSNGPTAAPSSVIVSEALQSVRKLLGMEVAFIAEFHGGRRIFRYVDSKQQFAPIEVGGSDPIEETYCQRILDGRLPEFLEDVILNQEASNLPITAKLGIGVYLGVPIRFSDGALYGTFCCFSHRAIDTPTDHHLTTLRLFAEFVGRVLEREATDAPHQEMNARIDAILSEDSFTVFYQPIIDIQENRVAGHEALARFLVSPDRPPDQWFVDAAIVGRQEELEIAVLKKAIKALPHVGDDTYLSLNVSPALLLSPAVQEFFAHAPLDRFVLEITEHALVNDYLSLSTRLAPLRERGMRIAVDDAGAGYASFRHILKLKPDIIKLDGSLIQRIDKNPDARALAAAVIGFAEQTRCKVVAEGVETELEMDVLRALNVRYAQGFFLGRPSSLISAVAPL